MKPLAKRSSQQRTCTVVAWSSNTTKWCGTPVNGLFQFTIPARASMSKTVHVLEKLIQLTNQNVLHFQCFIKAVITLNGRKRASSSGIPATPVTSTMPGVSCLLVDESLLINFWHRVQVLRIHHVCRSNWWNYTTHCCSSFQRPTFRFLATSTK